MDINRSVYLSLLIDSMWLDIFPYNLNLASSNSFRSKKRKGRTTFSLLRNVLKLITLETDMMNEKIFSLYSYS